MDDVFVFGDRSVFYGEIRWISDPETAVLVETNGG